MAVMLLHAFSPLAQLDTDTWHENDADDYAVETFLQNEGKLCHTPCEMLPPGAVAGQPRWPGDTAVSNPEGYCKTAFCGVGLVGCCKQGLAQHPCDGTVGGAEHQVCTFTHTPPAPPSPPPPLPPPPPGATLTCGLTTITFEVKAVESLAGMRGSSYAAHPAPQLAPSLSTHSSTDPACRRAPTHRLTASSAPPSHTLRTPPHATPRVCSTAPRWRSSRGRRGSSWRSTSPRRASSST